MKKTYLLLILLIILVSSCENFLEEEITANSVKSDAVEKRLEKAYDDLHNAGSATRVKRNFQDLELVYTDYGDRNMPGEILPFKYYYSEEADVTFNLCNVDRSVFICKGRLNREITYGDVKSGRCKITPIYRASLFMRNL